MVLWILVYAQWKEELIKEIEMSKSRKSRKRKQARKAAKSRARPDADLPWPELCKDATDEEISSAIKQGKDVNAVGERGASPIHHISARDSEDLAMMLLSKGANINARDENGWTPLTLAALFNHHHMVTFLLHQGADCAAKNYTGGMAALHIAARKGHIEAARAILQSSPEALNDKSITGATPLHHAAEKNQPTVMRMLIDMGASIEAKDCGDLTPLHVAAMYDATEAASLLISRGADIAAISGRTGSSVLNLSQSVVSRRMTKLIRAALFGQGNV